MTRVLLVPGDGGAPVAVDLEREGQRIGLVREMAEGAEEDDEFPLPRVRRRELARIVHFLRDVHAPVRVYPRASMMLEEMCPCPEARRHVEFLPIEELAALADAVSYAMVDGLTDLCAAAIVARLPRDPPEVVQEPEVWEADVVDQV